MEYLVSAAETMQGPCEAPPSKSYTIRAVLSGLLADGSSTVRSPLISRDTQAAFRACGLFGGSVEYGEGFAQIDGTAGKVKTPREAVDTLNSGTTIRICAAIASLCGGKVRLTGDDSIRRWPIKPLLDAL
jgi:3-phosphoshikimate 1-carboxyvinyltransferase